MFKTIMPQRLYVQIADQLRTLISEESFAPGERLPSERDLARRLGVSRPSLREALIVLEIEGVIEIRMGSGVYVSEMPAPTAPTDFLSFEDSPLETLRARALIETAIIASVVPTLKASNIQQLKSLVSRMENSQSYAEHLKHDKEFHLLIAEWTGNNVLTEIVSRLFDNKFSPISHAFDEYFQSRKTLASTVEEHAAIVSALEEKDAILASAAMKKHIDNSYKRLIADINEQKNNKGKPDNAAVQAG